MKKTIKFAFAALAAVTFASCSSDDLFGIGEKPTQQNKKGLNVEVENLIDPLTTRAAFIPTEDNNGKHLWMKGDMIRVYDDALTKYDEYAFDGEKFASQEEENIIKNPAYAVFVPETGGATLTDWKWVHATKQSEITYTIDSEDWTWAEVSDEAEGEMAYLSNVPMWGTAKEDADGEVSASLEYLTGVMKINLINVKENIKAIIVEGWEDMEGNKPVQMTGEFKAVLETKDGPQLNAALEATKEAGDESKGFNKITVKLYDEEAGEYKATENKSYLFIPIIARTYGKLKVSYLNDKDPDPIEVRSVNNVTFNRAQLRNFNTPSLNDIKSSGKDIPALNEELEKLVDVQGEVTITTQNKTEVTAEANTIIIPKGMKATKITLDLQGTTGTTLLNIKSEDYAGELIVKVPGSVNEETGANTNTAANKEVTVTSVYVNMPKANVVFAGNWYGVTLGKANTAGTLIVNTLTIASGATVSKILPNAECSQDNKTTADILVAENAVTGDITLPTSVATIDAITINGKTGVVNATSKDLEDNVIGAVVTLGATANVTTLTTIQNEIMVPAGATVGTINAEKATKMYVEGTVSTLNAVNGGSVYVRGEKGKITTLNGDKGSLQAVLKDKYDEEKVKEVGYLEIKGGEGLGTTASVGTACVRGASVFVNKSTSTVAITTLKMGDGKKLNLKGGYIGTLTHDTEGINAKDVKGITFVNEEATGVATAIKTATDVKFADYTSKWGGEKAGNGYYNTSEIWTASQFAAYTGTAATKLMGNIDLNNKAFTPVANVANAFEGCDKTISNVNITSSSNKGAGLFLTLATNGSVSNLKIDGIKISQTGVSTTIPTAATNYAVGALVANANAGSITAIEVANAELTSANWIVGGLVGNVAGEVTITGSRVKNDELGLAAKTSSTVTAVIEGKNNLGGLVGRIQSGKVEITGYKAVPTFKVTEVLNSEMTNRTNFGTVAPFVGTALAGELKVTTATGYATTDLTYAQKLEEDLHFDINLVKTVTPNTYETVDYYFVGRKEIGYVSASTFILNGNTYNTDKNNPTLKNSKTDVNKTEDINYYLLKTAYKD